MNIRERLANTFSLLPIPIAFESVYTRDCCESSDARTDSAHSIGGIDCWEGAFTTTPIVGVPDWLIKSSKSNQYYNFALQMNCPIFTVFSMKRLGLRHIQKASSPISVNSYAISAKFLQATVYYAPMWVWAAKIRIFVVWFERVWWPTWTGHDFRPPCLGDLFRA